MKVSVITLHRIYNYGSTLQAYATQKVFEDLGYEIEVIDYITPDRTLLKTFLKPGAEGKVSIFKNIIYRVEKIGSLILKERTFGRFIHNHLNLTKKYVTPNDLDRDPPKADIYVTGSDQVWNSAYNGIDRGFYLDFIPNDAERIAFAASFGKEALDSKEKETVRPYLERYKAISVREDSAVKIVKDMGIQSVVQLIDPTLQIAKDEWVKIASRRLVKEKYLILMLLYSEDNGATEFARKIADEKGLRLVKLSWEMKKSPLVDRLMTHRSPEDFLSLFYYADFVVTNSFHGLAFSINLEKQFIVVRRNEFNSRIESLLKLTNLENRLVVNQEQVNKVVSEQIDYAPVMQVLEVEREKARAFIRDAIS